MGVIFTEAVRALAALWLSNRTMLPDERGAIVTSLADAIQDAIDEWDGGGPTALDLDTAVTDASGRLIAPPQSQPAERPAGPWDANTKP